MATMGSGAADGLQQVLQRLFLDAQFRQRQREHDDNLGLRSRDLDIQERSAEATEGLRQSQLDANIENRKRLDEDRDASRDLQAEARFHGRLGMLPAGTRVSGTDAVEFAKRGLHGLLKPATNSLGEPEFEFGGTQATQAKNNQQESVDQHRAVMEALAQGRLDISQAMAELAKIRTSWGPPQITINTKDETGAPVTKVMPRTEASGQSFPAAPTTDERNRQAASGRAGAVLSAVSELSERINVGKGALAKVTGAVEKQKAQINLNDDIAEYQAVVSGFTPLLARALGHVGVLTEQDVQSVREALPKPGDSKSLRDRKVARITALVNAMSESTNPAPDVGPPKPTTQPTGGGVGVKVIREIK